MWSRIKLKHLAIIKKKGKDKRKFLPIGILFWYFYEMKNLLVLAFILASLSVFSGCYKPEGGSSIPWNEPSSVEGSLTPRVNF